jgi:hypothetical protein
MSRLSPVTATEIVTLARSDIKAWQCYPIGYVRGRVAGSSFVGEGGISSALSPAATADLNYYVDERCETAASPNVPLAADQSSAIRFFKYIGGAATLDVTPDISVFSPLTQAAKILNVTQPAAPTVLKFDIPSTINASTCTAFRLVAKNAQSEFSPVSTAQVPTYTFSTAPTGPNGIFTDPCSTAASSTLAIGVGLPKSDVYYLYWDSPGPLTLGGSGSSIPVEAVTITVAP